MMTLAIHMALLHVWIRDVQLRAYLAKSASCGGPYATEAHQWLKRWHKERGISFRVSQLVCSEWMREQKLIGERHAVMNVAIGRSANKGQHARAEREARNRRRQMRAERAQRV